jgi:hypothetical protein
VITRNTIGSSVAVLRDGPFVVAPTGTRPPYGNGSLGIEVTESEKIDFGNEVDFYGDRVLGLDKLGFHVFQTGENVGYGGEGNLPSIRIEINPNLSTRPGDTYSTMVWLPPAIPVADTNHWSGFLNAVTTGRWFLSQGEIADCSPSTPCDFSTLRNRLDDGGTQPTIQSIAVGKGRDHMWIGAVDGLRINRYLYDFEADGVHARRVS